MIDSLIVTLDETPGHEFDDDALFFRTQFHPDSGSAAEGSFSGPYTRFDALEDVLAEYFGAV